MDGNSYTYHSELEKQAEQRYYQRQRDKAEEQRLALEVTDCKTSKLRIKFPIICSMLQDKIHCGAVMSTQIPSVENW